MTDSEQTPGPASRTDKTPVKKEKPDTVNETVKTIIYALLIAAIVRTFTWQPYNIPSGSMIPTLLVGDYLFAAKFAYGFSEYSFPVDLPLFRGRILAKEPTRGDVVIFKWPRDDSTDYIKRVIGMPGDRIKVTNGQLFINGEAVRREAMPDFLDKRGHRSRQFMETLPGGLKHRILQDGDDGSLDNCPGNVSCMPANDGQDYLVPPGAYFCMGDNRSNSADSRVSDVGFVPFVNLEAKAQIIFFSLDEDAHFWEFWKWPADLRPSRMGDSIK